MKSKTKIFFISLIFFPYFFSNADEVKVVSEKEKDTKTEKAEEKKPEPPASDFEHEEAYMDIPEALRSRSFVHRAILSTIIRDTARVNLGHTYFVPSLGYSAVYQPSNRGGLSFAKFATGVIGLEFGFASKAGHCIALNFDYSGVSTLSVAYRMLFKSETFTFWPFLGLGLGTELGPRLADVPIEAQVYQGNKSMAYLTVGAIVPLVDLALKLEGKFNFFGLDRLMLTTYAGVLFFF